ncbi:hypothetical protein D3C74_293190 [compost metagenome]
MKLHKDGTIEGTPQEIYLYSKLTEVKKEPFKVVPPMGLEEYPGNSGYTIVSGTIDAKQLQPLPTLEFKSFSSPADYVRGLMSAITNKGDLH